MINDILGQNYIFHGTVVKQTDDHLVVQLFPGLILDLRTDDIDEIEQAEDEVTQRSYVRVKLKPDAEINANFKPRLARLAAAAEGGVPFTFGGLDLDAGEHAFPSGGAGAVPPLLDPDGVDVFQGRMPSDTWGVLAQAAQGAIQAATKATTSDTDYQTGSRTALGITTWKTYVDANRSTVDRQTDVVTDYKEDEKTDTKQDPEGW